MTISPFFALSGEPAEGRGGSGAGAGTARSPVLDRLASWSALCRRAASSPGEGLGSWEMGVGPQKAVDGEVREHLERQRQAQARAASETKKETPGHRAAGVPQAPPRVVFQVDPVPEVRR